MTLLMQAPVELSKTGEGANTTMVRQAVRLAIRRKAITKCLE